MKKILLITFLLSVIFNACASNYEVQAKEDLIVAEDFGTYTFNVIEFTPIETTKLATKSSLNFTFSEEITKAASSNIAVYINKVLVQDAYSWMLNSSTTLSLKPSTEWPQGSLISVIIGSDFISVNSHPYNGNIFEFEFIVDTEANFGVERIQIPTLVTRNNGVHNIPLHVALPKDRSQKVPVQFWVHGGGWNGGNATNSYTWDGPHSEYLAEELGIATLEIGYRCKGSDGTFAQAMEDIETAYQWAVANTETYNLDLKNSFFSGGSAGTPLSSLAAQLYPNIKAYVGFNGIYNFVNNPGSSFPSNNSYQQCYPSCEENSAIFKLRENPPITLLMHGNNDSTINYQQSVLFANAIVQAGGEAKAIIYPNETHAFFNKDKVQYEDCLYEMVKFLKSIGLTQ